MIPNVLRETPRFQRWIMMRICYHEQTLRPILWSLLRLRIMTSYDETIEAEIEARVVARTKELSEQNGALRESEERHRKLIENIGVGICQVAQDGQLISVNQKTCDILGYSRDELMAMNFLDVTHPDEREASAENFSRLIKGEVAQVTVQRRYIGKDGRIIWGVITVSSVSSSDGTGRQLMVVFEDATERKNAEIVAENHRNQLAHTARLNVLGELAAGMAHEINQPLTAISAYAQACRRNVKSGKADEERIVDNLTKIVAQTSRAAGILQWIRAFTKKRGTEKSTYNLNDAITGTISTLMHPGQRQNIDIVLELDESLSDVRADQIQIEQMVINLVLNSIESMQAQETRGKRILIKTSAGQTKDHANIAEILIQDNGPGMSSDVMEKIADPFYSTKVDGMGLGVTISKSIAESHGGQLTISSEPRKGTTCFIQLPINDGQDD